MPGDAERVEDPEERQLLARPRSRRAGCCAEVSPKPSSAVSCSSVQLVDVRHVLDQALVEEAVGVLLAQPLDVHRPLGHEVLDRLEQLARAARPGWGRSSTRRSSGLTVGVPQEGHFAGGLGRRRALLRASGPWPWATPPGGSRRRRASRSPRRPRARPCARRSSSLCSVASFTVTPETCTGSSWANGTMWPVRPTFHATRSSVVVAVIGANFQAIAPRGSRPDHAQLALERQVVDLHHHAVDLVVEPVAALLPGAARPRPPASSVSWRSMSGLTLKPRSRSHSSDS